MEEPLGSPSSSSTPPYERSYKEPLPELPQSLKDQGVELGISMSSQTFWSHPTPLDTASPYKFGQESVNNPIKTLKIPLTLRGQQGLVVYPLNRLLDPVMITIKCSINRRANENFYLFNWKQSNTMTKTWNAWGS